MSDRPWPENARPTAEQFADWYVTAERDERVRIAAFLFSDSERAMACFERNHDGLEREIVWQRRHAYRYRIAWLSARRRVHPRNFLRSYEGAA